MKKYFLFIFNFILILNFSCFAATGSKTINYNGKNYSDPQIVEAYEQYITAGSSGSTTEVVRAKNKLDEIIKNSSVTTNFTTLNDNDFIQKAGLQGGKYQLDAECKNKMLVIQNGTRTGSVNISGKSDSQIKELIDSTINSKKASYMSVTTEVYKNTNYNAYLLIIKESVSSDYQISEYYQYIIVDNQGNTLKSFNNYSQSSCYDEMNKWITDNGYKILNFPGEWSESLGNVQGKNVRNTKSKTIKVEKNSSNSNSSGGSSSSSKNTNTTTNNYNTGSKYPTITSGIWKGSEGSYWFDQGNGQYPSGNKWYYITTNGGAPGWENYYYWFDNEGYWRPQWYAKNDPNLGYETWGSGSSSTKSSGQSSQTSQTNNYQPSVPQQDNRNIQVLQNVEEKGSSEVGEDLLSLFNKQQSEYKSGSSNFSTSQNNSTPLTPNNSISINNQSNVIISNPVPTNNSGNTNNVSNISNNKDTSEIDELFDDGKFTGESYKSKTAVLTKQDDDSGQNWQWDNFEDNGWKPYTVNQKTTEGTGVWIQWVDGSWYFATNTENKLTWSDENKSEQTKGLKGSGTQYVISELINEGTYAIDKKLYTFDDNGKLLSSPNGMSGSKGLIQLNADGSIKSGHEISMDDSESTLKVYDKSEFESTGTKYILEKEDSKNYKVLGNGYFILKKTDTSYSLINATSPLNAKAISSAGTSLSKINEYLKKNGSSYEEAEEVEVVNGSISNSSKSTNTSNKTYTTATTTNYTSVNNLLGAVNNSQVNSDGELSLSLKDKTFLSNGKYYNNVDNKTYTLNEDGEIINIQTGNLGGTSGTYEIVQIGNVKFLVK